MLTGRRFPAGPLKPAPGGLFSAATVVESEADVPDWANGEFTWDTHACPVNLSVNDFCTTAVNTQVGEADGYLGSGWPFGIISKYVCLSAGLSPEERRRIVVEQLKAGSQKAVEHELWTGSVGTGAGHGDRSLTNGSGIDVSIPAAGGDPVPLSPEAAIARLEQALGDCGLGLEGVIHLTREAASLAATAGAIRYDGDRLLTRLGTPVSAGTGYDPNAVNVNGAVPEAGPDEIAAGPSVVWGFATGPVYVFMGKAEFLTEELDYDTNELATWAVRPAAVYWDGCCVASVQIGLSNCCGDLPTGFAPGGDPDYVADAPATLAAGVPFDASAYELDDCDAVVAWLGSETVAANPNEDWRPQNAFVPVVNLPDDVGECRVQWTGTAWAAYTP